MKNELPIMFFEGSEQWETWLRENHTSAGGLWLQIAKKGTGIVSITHAQALDVALCYGWIDGQRKAQNEKFFLQKFTPRRPKSLWSRVNTEKVTALIEQGRMQSAGLKEIEAAKQDGRWDAAYDPQSRTTIPIDFQEALDKNPTAKAIFATLNKQNQFAMCYRIQTAKRPETRRKRIDEFVAMLN